MAPPPPPPVAEPADPAAALAALWPRLARPFEPVGALSALTGLSRSAVGELVGTAIATSPEATRLLDEFPRTVRSLATSIATQAERCIGELRGPVLWSETLSARASSFGDPDLYVCATPTRAYDIDENRVLVAALVVVRDAARSALEHVGAEARYQDPGVRLAIRNGNAATRFVEHPSLADVRRGKLTSRELRRARSGKKRAAYAPAVHVLDRHADPVDLASVAALCDRRTRAQHELLVAVLDAVAAAGVRLPDLRADAGSLYAGVVEYHHPGRASERQGLHGIVVGRALLDVPDRGTDGDAEQAEAALGARAGGRPHAVVRDLGNVPRLVAQALAVDG